MKSILTFILLLIPATVLHAQISFDVSFPNAAHHEAEITMTVKGVPEGPFSVRMSRTSPGRYSLHEFAKNVYNVKAVDGAGQALQITRPNLHQWDVQGHDGTIVLNYTLYADRADGTYTQIDDTHAHMNMPATFMFARDLHNWPVEVTFHPPANSGWKVASQLFPTDNPMTFTAPSLQYFMDSPTELSDFSLREWDIPRNDGTDGTYTIRLAIHHIGTEAEVDKYQDMVAKVVEQQNAVYGGPPAFDGGTYTFIADYLPWASGDGMEHRNSTILSSTSSLATNALRLLGTVSHEYFHAWNVERIRPSSLEPFDFEQANMSPDLWFAEGFTSYYTPLLIRRAGITDDAAYARALTGGLNFVINSPARDIFVPYQMSMRAPFADRASSSVDPMNFSNTFISYYTWGSVIGLNLDLTLRGMDKTLDGYMKYVWKKHGVEEIPYTMAGLELALAEYTGDKEMANDFFNKYVRDGNVPDYAALLNQAGFVLQKSNPGKASVGSVRMNESNDRVTIQSNTIIGTPIYNAGLDRGDTILSINGKEITSRQTYREIIGDHKPGDELEIKFESRGQTKTATMKLYEDPSLQVLLLENTGKKLSDSQKQFREGWLGEK